MRLVFLFLIAAPARGFLHPAEKPSIYKRANTIAAPSWPTHANAVCKPWTADATNYKGEKITPGPSGPKFVSQNQRTILTLDSPKDCVALLALLLDHPDVHRVRQIQDSYCLQASYKSCQILVQPRLPGPEHTSFLTWANVLPDAYKINEQCFFAADGKSTNPTNFYAESMTSTSILYILNDHPESRLASQTHEGSAGWCNGDISNNGVGGLWIYHTNPSQNGDFKPDATLTVS